MSSGPEQLCGPSASSERLPGEADSSPRTQPTAPSQRDANAGQEPASRGERTCREPLRGPTPSLFLHPSRPAQRIGAPSNSGSSCCCLGPVPRGRPTHVPPRAVACQPRCCLLGHGASGASLVLVGRLTHGLVCGSGRRRGSGTWGLQTPHAGRPSGPSLDTRKWRLCRAKDPGDTGKEFLDCGAVTGRGEG